MPGALHSVLGMTKTHMIRNATIAAVTAGALLTGTPAVAAAPTPNHQPVAIDFGAGWTAAGEFDFPSRARGRLPVVVMLHGSGHNDRNQTLPEGKGSTFLPLSKAATDRGYAVLRFDKRGVTGVGPQLTDDRSQLAPPKPYERLLQDAAAAVRFAAQSPRVDPNRIYLLGHSEGTQVAANLAADPKAYGIPKPAGVIAMGVVGYDIQQLLTYQIFGVRLARLHEQFDVDGDGSLTRQEATDGLIGQPAADVTAYRKVLGPESDTNRDGRWAIDAEVGPAIRAETRIDDYPNLPAIDADTKAYAVDFARFPNVTESLPRFDGPSLLLNGESDVQTPARAALAADAAVAAAGRRDHRVVIYPGVGHTMNRTLKFTPAFGEPDRQVIADVQSWLTARR